MNETRNETTSEPGWLTTSCHVRLRAYWAGHIAAVVVVGDAGEHRAMSLHVSPAVARELAAELLAAADAAEAADAT